MVLISVIKVCTGHKTKNHLVTGGVVFLLSGGIILKCGGE